MLDKRKALRVLRGADPKLAALIDDVGRCAFEVEPLEDPFAALARAIVYQQLNARAAATIFGRVEAVFGGKLGSPEHILGTPEETLRAAGLSRGKLAAIRDLAQKRIEGVVPDRAALEAMSDDEIVERLTAVRGVGRWTVEMMLIFRLGRPDVLPATDYAIRKGFQALHKKRALPEPKLILKYGEIWRPHRTIASWYLWRAAERAAIRR